MRVSASVCAVLLAGVAGNVSAQQEDLSGVEIKSAPLGTGLYLLSGAGGNIAALTGADGVLLVDAEFGALAERIRAALKGLGAGQPPRFIIDTHYHYDHTDGNEAFATNGRHSSSRRRSCAAGSSAAAPSATAARSRRR